MFDLARDRNRFTKVADRAEDAWETREPDGEVDRKGPQGDPGAGPAVSQPQVGPSARTPLDATRRERVETNHLRAYDMNGERTSFPFFF